MIRYTRTNWQTNEKVETTEFVGTSLFVCPKTVQVMSDIWETQMVLTSVTPKGLLNEHSVSYEGMRPEHAPVYEVDATEEAFDLYRQRCTEDAYARLVMEAEAQAADPAVKGRVVKVVKGRKAVGTLGKVAVVIERPYGMGYRSSLEMKLGIATSARMVEVQGKYGKTFQNHADMEWVWARNCEVETVAEVDYDALRKVAEDMGRTAETRLRNQTEDARRRYGERVAA